VCHTATLRSSPVPWDAPARAWVEHALTNRLCGHVAELPPSQTRRNVEGTSRVGDDRRRTGREHRPERPTHVRSFFHNSAITLLRSRDATGPHQVRRESFRNGFGTNLTAPYIVQRTRSKGTTTQGINGLPVASTKRQRRLVDVDASTTLQPFQGGDTGSSPAGGVKESFSQCFRSMGLPVAIGDCHEPPMTRVTCQSGAR
jgi:hypothetical protein